MPSTHSRDTGAPPRAYMFPAGFSSSRAYNRRPPPPPPPAPLMHQQHSPSHAHAHSRASHPQQQQQQHGHHPFHAAHSPPVRGDVTFVPDSLAGGCFRCHQSFTFTRRKHHCRSCGNVVCASCSGKRWHMPTAAGKGGPATHSSKNKSQRHGAPYSSGAGSGPQPHPRPVAAVRVCDACYLELDRQRRAEETRVLQHQIRRAQQMRGDFMGHASGDYQHTQAAFFESTGAAAVQAAAATAHQQYEHQPEQAADEHPWGSDDGVGQAGGQQGLAWLTSFFYAQDPSGSGAAASSAGQVAAACTTPATPASHSPRHHIPSVAHGALHINPNHMDARSSPPPPTGAAAPLGDFQALSSRHAFSPPDPASLTREQITQLVRRLWSWYICIDPKTEQLWLTTPNVLLHSLPRKQLDALASEGDVEEQLLKKCRAYVAHVQRQVKDNREQWREFIREFDYARDAAEGDPADSPMLPPPFLPYPHPPPPFCSGTLLLSSFQTAFVPDYAIYYFWSHMLAVEERWQWQRGRAVARARWLSQQEDEAQAALALGQARAVTESPTSDMDESRSSSPCSSPSTPVPQSPVLSPGLSATASATSGSQASFHSVALLDQAAQVMVAEQQQPAAPPPSSTSSAGSRKPSTSSPSLLRRSSSGASEQNSLPHSQSQSQSNTPGGASSSRRLLAMPRPMLPHARSMDELTPEGGVRRSASHAQLSLGAATPPPASLSASACLSASPSQHNLAASVSSLVFASCQKMSQRHLPHYRLLQRSSHRPSSAAPASLITGFNPLSFAPPLVSIPQLALRKLKQSTHDRGDLGVLEFKSKLHHATLRIVFANLVRSQRFGTFKEVARYAEYFSTFAQPLPGANVVIQQQQQQQQPVQQNGAAGVHPSQQRSLSSPIGAVSSPSLAPAAPPMPVLPPPAAPLAQSEIQRKVFAFKLPWKGEIGPEGTTDPGWSVYNPRKEYERLGLISSGPPPSFPFFRLSTVNSKYSYCPSYPALFVVPSLVSDGELAAVAAYRSKRRIPVVVWRGPVPRAGVPAIKAVEEGAGTARAAAQGQGGRPRCALMLRSAQPLTGLTGQRCAEDEQLLQHAVAAAGSDRLLIVDCRPMANAIGQAALGAGYETPDWYISGSVKGGSGNSGASSLAQHGVGVGGLRPSSPSPLSSAPPSLPLRGCEIAFLNVDNIHAIRKTHAAVEKIITRLCEEEADMEANGWGGAMGTRVFQTASNGAGAVHRRSTVGAVDTLAPTTTSPAPASAPPVPSTPAAPPSLSFPTPHPSAASWLSALHATGHFSHLANILSGTNHVLSCLAQGIVVLIHCSDGWDRTAQLTSLSQVCLDGYYRTMEGIIVLIEKEWVGFGHRFQDRLGHGSFTHEVAPVFLQFIDCLSQLMVQFPTHFQFNLSFLLYLHSQLYSGETGTFFFNSEEDRMRNRAGENTRSAWWYVTQHLDEFVNPLYGQGWNDLPASTQATLSYEPHPLFASLALYPDPTVLHVDVKELRFFSELYLCYKDRSQGLAWEGNHLPSVAAALGVPGNVATPFSNHSNPALDLNPLHWVLECRAKQGEVEVLQSQLSDSAQAERDALAGQERAEEEAVRLRRDMYDLSVASAVQQAVSDLLASVVERDVERAVAEAVAAALAREASKPRVLQRSEVESHLASPAPAVALDKQQQFGSPTQAALLRYPTLLRSESSWANDNAVACRCCHNRFGFILRAHHCRVCAGAFCDTHSPKTQLLAIRPPEFKSGKGGEEAKGGNQAEVVVERVCGECVAQITARAMQMQRQAQGDTNAAAATAPQHTRRTGAVPPRSPSVRVGPGSFSPASSPHPTGVSGSASLGSSAPSSSYASSLLGAVSDAVSNVTTSLMGVGAGQGFGRVNSSFKPQSSSVPRPEGTLGGSLDTGSAMAKFIDETEEPEASLEQ